MGKDQEQPRIGQAVTKRGIVRLNQESPHMMLERGRTVAFGTFDGWGVGPRANVEFFKGLAREREARRHINATICSGQVPSFLVWTLGPGPIDSVFPARRSYPAPLQFEEEPSVSGPSLDDSVFPPQRTQWAGVREEEELGASGPSTDDDVFPPVRVLPALDPEEINVKSRYPGSNLKPSVSTIPTENLGEIRRRTARSWQRPTQNLDEVHQRTARSGARWGSFSFHGGPSEPKRLGLNHLKTFRQHVVRTEDEDPVVVDSTKYGPRGAQLADAALLGATLTRQLGGRDLGLSFLLPLSNPTRSADLQRSDPVPVFSSSSMSFPDASSRAAELGELLTDASSAGTRLSCTFPMISGQRWPLDYTSGWYDGVDYFHALGSMFLDTTSCLELTWDHFHEGQRDLEPSPARFPRHADHADGWHRHTLDGSAPYKRAYLKYLAQATSEILEAATSTPESLHEIVESIELFNEVESLSAYHRNDPAGLYEPATTGEVWGRACAWAAHGFRLGLRDPEVQIGLPGIHSHDKDVAGAHSTVSWASRLEFIRGLVGGMTDELLSVDERIGLAPEYLGTYIQSIDLHYYHHEEGQTRHIGYLPLEVDEIFEAVGDGLDAGLRAAGLPLSYPDYYAQFGQPVLDAFQVTVMESGCSATGESEVPAGFGTAQEFQAFEVWRRIGGALASRASAAGWHSWMAGEGGFAGFGLRNDVLGEDGSAALAYPRTSWYAYYRLAHTLGDVTSGRMVVPAVADKADLTTFLSGGDAHAYVVFEYQRLDRTAPYAYLVLVDPFAPRGLSVSMHASIVPSSTGRARRLNVLPASVSPAHGSGSLPAFIPSYDPAEPLAMGVPLRLHRGDFPVLVYANAPITWEVVMDTTTRVPLQPGRRGGLPGPVDPRGVRDLGAAVRVAEGRGWASGVAAALHLDVPAWMDDPTVPIRPRVPARRRRGR